MSSVLMKEVIISWWCGIQVLLLKLELLSQLYWLIVNVLSLSAALLHK